MSALPLLGRTEPGHAVCMQLRWQTPNGHNRIQSAMRLLEALEQLGILSLPAREGTLRDRQRPVVPGLSSDPHPEIGGPLAECGPLQVVAVRRRQTVGDWRELAAARSKARRLRRQMQAAHVGGAWLESRLDAWLRPLFVCRSGKQVDQPGKEDVAALPARPHRLPGGAIADLDRACDDSHLRLCGNRC